MVFAIVSIALTVELYKEKRIEKAAERLVYLFAMCFLSVAFHVDKLWTFIAVGAVLVMEQYMQSNPMPKREKRVFFLGGIVFLACRVFL